MPMIDERPCDCGDCRSCNAHMMSDNDSDYVGSLRLQREELDVEWRDANNDHDYGALDDYDDCSGDY